MCKGSVGGCGSSERVQFQIDPDLGPESRNHGHVRNVKHVLY